MKYFLKHQNLSVLELELDIETNTISKIVDVINPEHLPIGVKFFRGIVDRRDLNLWFKGRNIPASRHNIENILDMIGETSTEDLITKCYGLSLTDAYWLCPKELELDYDEINFFDNDFSLDMGELLFGNKLESFNLMSPDNTSDGWLKKKWVIKDGDRYLVKGASGIYRQEPFNEVIANVIMESLGVEHVKYDLEYIEDQPYSVCKNFITKNTELVSAYSVANHFKKPNNISMYEHLIASYEKLGIKDARVSLEKMIVSDFLVANTDRHMNNFGLIRDVNTLEFIGVAPIFDSGTSMYMSSPVTIKIEDVQSKPFEKLQIDQIKLVKSKIKLQSDVRDKVFGILNQNKTLSVERIEFVMSKFDEALEKIATI